jgi:hypothetical protein
MRARDPWDASNVGDACDDETLATCASYTTRGPKRNCAICGMSRTSTTLVMMGIRASCAMHLIMAADATCSTCITCNQSKHGVLYDMSNHGDLCRRPRARLSRSPCGYELEAGHTACSQLHNFRNHRRTRAVSYYFTGNCGLTGLTKSLPNDKFAGTRRLTEK